MNKLLLDRMRSAAGDLWEQAITHPSGGKEHNQRLEFLGSGVLDLALADVLYHRHEGQEGELSAISNHLRSDEVLNEVGRKIGLDAFLVFEMSTYYKPVDSIVTTGMRAVIGAIRERAGYDMVRGLVEELFVTDEMLKRAKESHDSISELKGWLERSPWKPMIMAYDAVVDGKKVFYHSIEYCDMNVIGTGPSRMKAEAQASRLMLSRMSDPPPGTPLHFVSPSDHCYIEIDGDIDGEDES